MDWEQILLGFVYLFVTVLFGKFTSPIHFISLASFWCVFSNASLNCFFERMHSRIGCTCLAFLHCVSSNVPSKCLHVLLHTRIGCIFVTFLCYPSLWLKPEHRPVFYLNLVVQDFGPYLASKKCCPLCNFIQTEESQGDILVF